MANPFQLDYFAISDVARRKNNEDYLLFFVPEQRDPKYASGALFVLADGVGGASMGEKASKHASEVVVKEYYRLSNRPPAERLQSAFQKACQEIFEFAEDEGQFTRMATTLVAAAIVQDTLFVANVGDSRAYLVRGNQVDQITKDHNQAAELVRDGVMTEEEALHSSVKNKLTRSIGGEPDVMVDIFTRKLQMGDRLLLCSDGLTRYITKEKIMPLVTKDGPEAIAERLISFALKSGGADNVSVLPIEIVQKSKTTLKAPIFRNVHIKLKPDDKKASETPSKKPITLAPEKKKPRIKLSIIIIGFLAVAVLVGGGIYFSKNPVTLTLLMPFPTQNIQNNNGPVQNPPIRLDQTLTPPIKGISPDPSNQVENNTQGIAEPTMNPIPTNDSAPTCLFQMNEEYSTLDSLTRKFYKVLWPPPWPIKKISCYSDCNKTSSGEASGCSPEKFLTNKEEFNFPTGICGNNPWIVISPIQDVPKILSSKDCLDNGGFILSTE
jgi:serine/threonine protein phosphatase PrpC